MAENRQEARVAGVKISVKSNKDGRELHLIVRRNSKMKAVLRGFCQHMSLEYRATRFVFDHRDFCHDKTPEQLGMQDGDQIDALSEGNGA